MPDIKGPHAHPLSSRNCRLPHWAVWDVERSIVTMGPCACVLSRFRPVRLCVTLWTAACQASLSMGFSRQEYWNGFFSLSVFPTQGSILHLLHIRHWQTGSLPLGPSGKSLFTYIFVQKLITELLFCARHSSRKYKAILEKTNPLFWSRDIPASLPILKSMNLLLGLWLDAPSLCSSPTDTAHLQPSPDMPAACCLLCFLNCISSAIAK